MRIVVENNTENFQEDQLSITMMCTCTGIDSKYVIKAPLVSLVLNIIQIYLNLNFIFFILFAIW